MVWVLVEAEPVTPAHRSRISSSDPAQPGRNGRIAATMVQLPHGMTPDATVDQPPGGLVHALPDEQTTRV